MLRLAVLGPVLGLSQMVGADAPTLDDFAFTLPLDTRADSAIYALHVPRVVYESTVRPDLGDLRIFNSQAQVVPHMLRCAPSHRSLPERRETITLEAKPSTEQPHQYLFESTGWYPVDSAAVELPERNTMVEIELLTRADETTSWKARYHGPTYELSTGEAVVGSESIALTATTERYWRVDVNPAGGGLGSGLPSLTLGWHAHEILFVARGKGPFQLAFGSGRVEPIDPGIHSALNAVNERDLERLVRQTQTGEPLRRYDEGRLLAPGVPFPWRKGFLWSVLLASVLALSAAAWRLGKRMEAPHND